MIAAVARYVDSLPWSLKALLALGFFVLTFLASLTAVAVVVVRLPETYFLMDEQSSVHTPYSVGRWASLILRNLAGAVLVLVGLLLSLHGIPGQGVLTVLIGLMLLSFPGKRRLERRLVSRPNILAAVNALRARFGKPALRLT